MSESQPPAEQPKEDKAPQLTYADLDKFRADARRDHRNAGWLGFAAGLGVVSFCGGVYFIGDGLVHQNQSEALTGLFMAFGGGVSSVALGVGSTFSAVRAKRLDNALLDLINRSKLDQSSSPESGLQSATEYSFDQELNKQQSTMGFVIASTQLEDLLATGGVDLNRLREIAPSEQGTPTGTNQQPPSPIQPPDATPQPPTEI